MTGAEQSGAAEQLKRLRNKAELCRYAHERMRSAACCWRRTAEVIGVLLSFALFAAGLALFRNPDLAREETLVLAIVVLPPLALLVRQISRIFGWGDRETRCEVAVHLWGQWIREADFLGRRLSRLSEEKARESMSGAEEKYRACMDKTPTIPARKFLRYKIDFRKQLLLSQKIDNADEDGLAVIERGGGGTWGTRS